jgi:hypothetical protein
VQITFGIEMKKLINISWALAIAFSLQSFTSAQDVESKDVVEVTLSEDGKLEGHVFTMIEDEEAPIAGKVTLTAEGKTVTSKETDPTGNFSFEDVKPGLYTMVGVAGEYVGDKVIEVKPFEEEELAGEYTAIPLKVAPAFEPAALEPFAAMPLQTLSSAPVLGNSYFGGMSTGCSACNTCGGGGFGGGFGSGGGFGAGLNLRRLALIGGTVGLAVGLSGPSSPDE